jgi:ariadne-1
MCVSVFNRHMLVVHAYSCDVHTCVQQMATNDCGHSFCADCWDAYLTQKVMGEGVGATIECMHNKCRIFVDDALAL